MITDNLTARIMAMHEEFNSIKADLEKARATAIKASSVQAEEDGKESNDLFQQVVECAKAISKKAFSEKVESKEKQRGIPANEQWIRFAPSNKEYREMVKDTKAQLKKALSAIANSEKVKSAEKDESVEKAKGHTDPSKGMRFNGDKPRMSLLPFDTLQALAVILTKGAMKYDSHNWEKGLSWSETVDSLLRHLTKALTSPHELDEESGEPHMFHMAINALFLATFYLRKMGANDLFRWWEVK